MNILFLMLVLLVLTRAFAELAERVSLPVIVQSLYSANVVMALVTTEATPIILRRIVPPAGPA